MAFTLSAPSLPAPSDRTGLRPGRAIAWFWVLALVLSLYGAEDVVLAVHTSSWLGENRSALALVDGLGSAARASRLSALHHLLEGDPPPPREPPAATPPPVVSAAPPAPRPIARVLLVGASTIQFHLGVELERVLATDYQGLTIQRLGKLSTGLTRPDVFDWPAKLRDLVAAFQPDLVIANFGGNDAQGVVLPGGKVSKFGRPEWDQTYRTRMTEIVAIGRAAGAQVLLLGMSTTRDLSLTRRMARINTLTEEAARLAGAHYLSIWDLGADARGQYREVAIVDGVPIKTRLADGKHFSRAGAAFVSTEIARRIAALYQLQPEGSPLAGPH
jgi:hypothetical protein